MNQADIDRIADAILYEGYILYPYRPSVKNRQRWTFGGLYPDDYCRARRDGSASSNQTECLVRGTADSTFDARVRFLHLTARRIGAFTPPLADWTAEVEPPSRAVEALRVGDRTYHAWQEAEERAATFGAITLGTLTDVKHHQDFTFPGGRTFEPVRAPEGAIVGVLIRERQVLAGRIESAATEVAAGLYRITLRVLNQTPQDETRKRDEALLGAFASTHALLSIRDGAFVSLLDPPDDCRAAAAGCRNVGSWPVLVGAEGDAETMLAAPIILYDYPQVAPESPGDFFDGTEMDEMLTLRIMTLTDEEKEAMADVDRRAHALLARTEATGRDQMLGLHGTIREFRPVPGEGDDA